MTIITREQREALHRVWSRNDVNFIVLDCEYNRKHCPKDIGAIANLNMAYSRAVRRLTYRQYRKLAIVGRDCIMIHWLTIWLGIETDGYTHS